ncbi:putative zinc finger protein [Orchesella cincta]|uniref:Putative zinc finger protein n=1 Tax=Orchesella cincta TaxID=48709 RepID=A0A1D2M7U7_ORCCI|nr:putative zinc finger protein [Orchesella cincta]
MNSKLKADQTVAAFKCSICPKSYVHQKNLDTHILSHTNERPYKCSTCQQSYRTAAYLKLHEQRVHTHAKVKKIECIICQYRARTIFYLMKHINVHTRERPYNCPECQQHLDDSYIKVHIIREHRPEEWHKFKCSLCAKQFDPKAFSRRNRLTTHLGSHNKPFSCPICKKKLATKAGLKLHLIAHSGEKPASYKECPARFSTVSVLNQHVKQVHRTERPFPCNLCGKAFARAGLRNEHLASHLNERPVKCQICGLRFTTGGFKDHHKRHSELGDTRCPACPKRFLFSTTLFEGTFGLK